jgi:hypothetical protein
MISILICVWIEHRKSACLCGLGHHRRLRSLDPHCRPKLRCARFMDLRCSHPHNDRAPERFRPHLKSIPFGAAYARPPAAESWAMADRIRIIPHAPEGIPDCGSFEVWFADGRASQYFYWDDNPGRASTTRKMGQDQAREAARALSPRC